MTEHLKHSPEATPTGPEHEKRQHEAHKEAHEKAKTARHEHAEQIDEIRREAAEAAISHEETKHKIESHTRPDNDQPLIINNELKAMAYKRTLRRTQGQLSPASKALSKVIHTPAIESASEIAGKTVARPSGILAGGVVALLGSSIFLWAARHYGYEYNFLLFAALFVCGFFIGLLIELIARFLLRNRET